MYRIPKDLDLSPVVGEFTTQLRVGQFDFHFTLGRVNFIIESPITLYRSGVVVARWEAAKWPDPGFYDIMNATVTSCLIASDRLIVLGFENGITMHLEDSSDQYESMRV